MEKSTGDTLKVFQFKLSNVLICVDIKYIIKVLPLVELEPVPLSQPYLAGMMNFAGKSIPTIDLAIALGLDRKNSYTVDTPLLLCTNGSDEMAVIVDSVQGIETINAGQIQMRDEFKKENPFFLGTVIVADVQLLLIDMHKIFLQFLSHVNVVSTSLTDDK